MSTEEGTIPAPADDSGAAARIRQLVARVKELEAKVAEVEPLAQQADKWRGQYEEARASSKAEREALRLEREIMSAGVMDAEGLDYVQHAPAEPAVWSAEAISRLSPTEFRAHREAIMASLKTA